MILEDSEKKILSDLRRRRGVVKASLTRVQTFINNLNSRDDPITLLEFRQEELPQINRKFDDVQCEIELIDADNFVEAEKKKRGV